MPNEAGISPVRPGFDRNSRACRLFASLSQFDAGSVRVFLVKQL